MSNFVVTIISGIIVAIIVSWLGIGGSKKQVIMSGGVKVRKTGKLIIIISVIIIIWGMLLLGNNSNPTAIMDMTNRQAANGLLLMFLGAILLIIGKIVAWFQRL